MILTPEVERPSRLRCDVVVVGSGAGGGAATHRLAERGLDVVCLEEGGWYDERSFSQDVGTAWRQLYAEDGQRVMNGPIFIPVAGGKALGGSTVVNSGICFRIPESRYAEWREQYGLDIEWGELDRFLREVERTLRVGPSNRAVWGGNNAFCQEGMEALGWSGGPMPRNAPYCAGCGACNTGCPSGAKLGVDKTWIPAAAELGARFIVRARADEPIVEGGRVVGLRGRYFDGSGATVVGSFEVHARCVVLACGSIEGPAWLQRNGLGNEHVGEHLHVHPGTGCIGFGDRPVRGWRGIPQGWYSDEFHASDGIMLESFWAGPEIYYQSFPFGREGTAAMVDFDRMVAVGGIIADRSEGSVRAGTERGRTRVRYVLTDDDARRIALVSLRSTQLLLAAGAHEVRTAIHGVPPISSVADLEIFLDPQNIGPHQLGAVYSSHPHGSIRMAGTPELGAVDGSGRLYGVEGLRVMDGSVFPDVLGVNPQITIMALSRLLANRLADDLA